MKRKNTKNPAPISEHLETSETTTTYEMPTVEERNILKMYECGRILLREVDKMDLRIAELESEKAKLQLEMANLVKHNAEVEDRFFSRLAETMQENLNSVKARQSENEVSI